jgi:hypothetical protein
MTNTSSQRSAQDHVWDIAEKIGTCMLTLQQTTECGPGRCTRCPTGIRAASGSSRISGRQGRRNQSRTARVPRFRRYPLQHLSQLDRPRRNAVRCRQGTGIVEPRNAGVVAQGADRSRCSGPPGRSGSSRILGCARQFDCGRPEAGRRAALRPSARPRREQEGGPAITKKWHRSTPANTLMRVVLSGRARCSLQRGTQAGDLFAQPRMHLAIKSQAGVGITTRIDPLRESWFFAQRASRCISLR